MSSLFITIIQSALVWENKTANLKMFEEKIGGISNKTEIIVLPEMFSTGFSMKPKELGEKMDGEAVQWMKQIAAKKKIILIGSVIIEEGENYFNRLLCVFPNGKIVWYDKRHLFAYAGEDKHYSAGEKRIIISVNGWKIYPLICYDLRFPVWCRRTSEHDFDVALFVANWPERRNHAWKTLLQARAIENQSFTIGVNRVGKDGNDINHSGDSLIVDPMGKVLYLKEHEEDVFTIELKKEFLEETRTRLPFWKDGDNFKIEL